MKSRNRKKCYYPDFIEVIEAIQRFQPKFRASLLRFLQGNRVPLTLGNLQFQIGLPDRPHARATLRCYQACQELEFNPIPTSLSSENIAEVVKATWVDPNLTSFGSRNLYSDANILFLAKVSGSSLIAEIQEYVAREIEEELKKKQPNVYLLLLAREAYESDRLDAQLFEVALRVLFDQIVYCSARLVLEFDSAKLAAAAVLGVKTSARNSTISKGEFEQVIRRAVEILLTSNTVPAAMWSPRPQFGERNSIIHTVPVEGILLISRLPIKYFPINMPTLLKIATELIHSFVELPSGESGWTIESDCLFPQPMSWITAIYSELLERSLKILRYAFTESYLRKAEESDPSRVERFSNGLLSNNLRDWGDVLETEEGAKEIIFQQVLGGVNQPKKPRKHSLLMFGPPGTAKTTFARAIAFQLNRKLTGTGERQSWPILTVNPADVLSSGGYSGLVANLRKMFREFRALSEVVVFFDEAENLVFGRDREGESREDRLITAAMLPILQNIDEGNIVFIMATNYVREIDFAVRRKGRFALRIGIGFPCKEGRKQLIRKLLTNQNELETIDFLAEQTNSLTIKEIAALCEQINLKTCTRAEVSLFVERAKNKAEISSSLSHDFTEDLKIYHDRI